MGSRQGRADVKLRASVPRLDGVDLKAAEHVTRRLLQAGMAPDYVRLPRPPSTAAPAIKAFFTAADPFSALHPAVDPAWRGTDASSGRPFGVPATRSARKRQQIAAMVRSVLAVLLQSSVGGGVKRPGRIMDLCGGCGHVGLVLAALLPAWDVVVVDAKPFALRVAAERAREVGLANLKTKEMDIGEIGSGDPVDVVVALHACGDASDIALDKAMRAGAAAVVAPCCVGGVVSAKPKGVPGIAPATERGEKWDAPRSAKYEAELTGDEYRLLIRAADFGDNEAIGDGWRRAAKTIVEGDRMAWAQAMGNHVRMVKMDPVSCTPKNDILVLWPWKWDGSEPVAEQRGCDVSSKYAGGSASANWEVNEEANRAVMEVVGENGLLLGFDAASVATVDRELRAEVSAPDSYGELVFPPSQGARARKIVHAVAGSLGLYHESLGTGAGRHVVVRRGPQWPFFFKGYLGFSGPWIRRVVDELGARVPPSHSAQRAATRDGHTPHITIVAAKEIKCLPSRLKRVPTELLTLAKKKLEEHPPRLIGLGRVVDGKDSENDVYFGVVDWPEAATLRASFGLPSLDFHVTLGFAKCDVHGVCKDSSTLVAI